MKRHFIYLFTILLATYSLACAAALEVFDITYEGTHLGTVSIHAGALTPEQRAYVNHENGYTAEVIEDLTAAGEYAGLVAASAIGRIDVEFLEADNIAGVVDYYDKFMAFLMVNVVRDRLIEGRAPTDGAVPGYDAFIVPYEGQTTGWRNAVLQLGLYGTSEDEDSDKVAIFENVAAHAILGAPDDPDQDAAVEDNEEEEGGVFEFYLGGDGEEGGSFELGDGDVDMNDWGDDPMNTSSDDEYF